MHKPNLLNWFFIRMTNGQPVEENVVEGILTTIDEKGEILMDRMEIGLSGDAKSAFGEYDMMIYGLRSKVIRIRKDERTGKILLVTVTLNEYLLDRDAMLEEKDARKRLKKQEKERRALEKIETERQHSQSELSEAIAWTTGLI